MAEEPKKDLKSKFGSSLLAGAQGLGEEPRQPKKAPQVRIARSTYTNMLSTRILKSVLTVFAILIVVYIAFAATIMRVIPSTSAGLIPVKNITYEGGLVPAGATVVLSMTKAQGSSIGDYLLQAVVPQADVSVVKVIAGPWGTFGWAEPGIIAVHGKIVNDVLMPEPQTKTLDDEYLVECLRGACKAQTGYIIPADRLIGVPLGEKG